MKAPRFLSASFSTVWLWLAALALLTTTTATAAAAELADLLCDARTGKCDTHERCPVWAEQGECQASFAYMREHCPGACATKSQPKSTLPQHQQKKDCRDRLDRCAIWAELGECNANADEMHKNCPRSCGVCDGQHDNSIMDKNDDTARDDESTCVDLHPKCGIWADMGECENNPTYMHPHCARSCDTCHKMKKMEPPPPKKERSSAEEIMKQSKFFGEMQKAEGEKAVETLERIQATITYMESDEVLKLPHKVRSGCLNRHDLCTFWQVVGECENNKAYMTTNCAPACHTCHMIDFQARCPPLPEGTLPALEPGDLDAMFTRIISTAPGNQTHTTPNPDIPPYTVTVHSTPDDNGRPWVITFDNFVTQEEADALIQHGYEEGYKRSEDVGKQNFDGSYDSVQSSGRTSENAWCSAFQGCRWKEVPKRILDRISAVTGIQADNSEDLQLLKYQSGQFYNTHHDYIEHQKDRNCGPRILTFFLYLSDVEEGGGTDFPDLGITVQPKRGRAVLWPSIRNEAPLDKDKRMRHQALPVIKGVKFAANAWIHMYDYVTPQENGCN